MKKSSGFWIMKSLLFCMCLFFVISSGCTGERGHNGLNGKNGINGINNLTPNMTANSSSFYNNSYALLRGQFGGQILNGGQNTGENLTLNATANGVGTVNINPYMGEMVFGSNKGHYGEVKTGLYFSLIKMDTYYPPVLEFGKPLNINGFDLGTIVFTNLNNTGGLGFWKTSAYISGIVETSDSNLHSDAGARLSFFTKPESGNNVERLRIAGGGNVTVYGNISINKGIQNPSFGAGTLMTDSLGNFYVISDPKLKTDIKPYVSGLKEILSIPSSAMITYKFRPESGLDTINEYSGFDASILSSAIPEAVFSKLDTQWIQQKTGKLVDGEDEYTSIEVPKLNEKGERTSTLSISDRSIIAAQITAIQELNAKIEAQQAQIDNLMARIAKLEKGVKL